MEVKVVLRNVRIAPRKSREVVDLIRNKTASQARALLEFAVKRSADPVLKLLNSAVASAVHDFQLEESNLYIAKIMVDEGPKLKRSHPMSRGRAYPIYKRTSHITLVLSDRAQNQPKEKVRIETTVEKEPQKVKSSKKITSRKKTK